MMRILYLHGLESSNVGDKVDFLKSVSDCYAPKIDYTDPNLEKHLMKMVKSFQPDLIIGSSIGGYAGLLLANYYDIKAVVFNPAIHSRSIELELDRLEAKDPKFNFQPLVVLGLEDDVIDPKVSKEIFEDAIFHSDIVEVENMGHRISLNNLVDIYKKYIEK